MTDIDRPGFDEWLERPEEDLVGAIGMTSRVLLGGVLEGGKGVEVLVSYLKKKKKETKMFNFDVEGWGCLPKH